MTTAQIDQETRGALEVARSLAVAGVPLFVAVPDPSTKVGFALPPRWEQTPADPAVVDRWEPGMALCAVMGQRPEGGGLDVIDIDPRNGGDVAGLNGHTPHVYGAAATPSGGTHLVVAPLGVSSRSHVFPGIDVKSGAPGGVGRGFVFLAPTTKASKTTGEPGTYRWIKPPDLSALEVAWRHGDDTGAKLAARIRELRAGSNVVRGIGGPAWWQEFLLSSEPQSVPAADKAIDTKLDEVRTWHPQAGEDFRRTLLRAALTLGGYVGGGHLDEAEARARLEEAVSVAWPAPDDDDRRWIQQGLDDGAALPFHVFTAEQEREFSDAGRARAGEGEDLPPEPGTPDDTVGAEPPWNVFSVLGPAGPFDPRQDSSDQGLAKAVAYRMYPVLRYAADSSTWIKRERDTWEEVPGDLSEWAVGVLAELMPLGEHPIPKDLGERTEAHWQAHRRDLFVSSAGSGRISRKLKAVVRSDHPTTLRLSELDTNPEVLWAGGVPWNLAASADVPTPAAWIDPATPHLRTAACAPDPTVATPRWDRFIAAVLPDAELRTWALRVLGIALTGYPDAALPILYGRERSGKSSLVESLMLVLGSYAHAANPKLLAAGGAEGAAGDAAVFDLKARRLAFIDEGPKRGHDATERLKQLTGGASMTAAKKYGNPVTFAPTHTLVMTSNAEPGLTDPALRARVRLIPCDEPEELVRPARLPLLGRGLRAEAPGILAALMREAAGYLADRDSASMAAAPGFVRGLTSDIAAEQDPVREWLEACTQPCDPPGTRAGELRRAFAEWHQAHPDYRRASVPSPQAFGRALAELGVPREHFRDGWYWQRRVTGGPGGAPGPAPTVAAFLGGPDPSHTAPNAHTATPNAHMASRAPSPTGVGVTDMGPRDGSVTDHQPTSVTADNPRSTAVFAGSVTDVTDSSLQKVEDERRGVKKNTEERVRGSVTVTDDLRGAPADSVTCDNAAVTDVTEAVTAVTPPQNREHTDTRATSDTPPPKVPSARTVSKRETAARADQAKIDKAEARRQLAEEKRLAAVAEVGGEVHPLPAVVDRAGHVIPISVDQAAAVVRAALGRTCACPGSVEHGPHGHLTVDVETSGYPVGHELYELRSVQLGDAFAVAVVHPVEHARLIDQLAAEAVVLHAHSATADLVPLDHAELLTTLGGADVAWQRMYDTVLPAKLADPASTGSDPGLKKLAPAVLGAHAVVAAADEGRQALFKAGKWLTEIKADTPVARSGWAQVPTGSEAMLRYAGSDVLDTGALAATLPPVDLAVLARERLAQRMTARVTHRGVRIDPEQVAMLTLTHTQGLEAARARVRAVGVDNPGSSAQVGEKLLALGADLPRTPTDKPSVTASVLEGLRGAAGEVGAFVGEVLTYRHHETALGLFLDPFRQLCEHGDGRVRPTVYTLGTNTGRMATTRMNLQQLPREGGVRACIVADPGMTIVSADFSSVELRVAAALSGDAALSHLIAEEDAGRGDGLHWQVARQVWGPDATKSHRYIAKRGVFGRLYGAGIPGVARAVGIDEATAAAVVEALDVVTPQLAQWSRGLANAVQRGQTQYQSYSGRVIHMPRDRSFAAGNYAIQGSARELLVDAMHRWSQTPWGTAVMFPVHDEVVAFVPEADGAAATAALVACMTTELGGVTIRAEADEPSTYWQDSA